MAQGKQGARNRWPAWLLVSVAGLVFFVFLVNQRWPSGTSGIPGLAGAKLSRGEALYEEKCVKCHGARGLGENPAAPKGGQKLGGAYLAPALDARGHAHHHSPQALFEYIRDGSPEQTSSMKGFRQQMSDDDIRAVLAYIVSLWPESLREQYARSQRLRPEQR
jgi:mono/diheme cytochrome c family protein